MLRTTCVLAIACLGLMGCVDRHLYHYHRTVIGLDIAGSVDGNAPRGHLVLGYARRLVVVVPPEWKIDTLETFLKKKDLAARKGSMTPEELRVKADESIPSTVFCTQVGASMGGVNTFREILATGEPAESYAALLAATAPPTPDASARNFVCPNLSVTKQGQ